MKRKTSPIRPRTFKQLRPEDAQAPKWGRSVNRQAQAMIFSVFLFIRDELNRGVPLYPFDTIWSKLAAAVGLCQDTVKKYVAAGLAGSTFDTPGKKRPRPRHTLNIDKKIAKKIRRLIYDYAESRRSITLSILMELIRENDIKYSGGRDSLRKLILRMGFKFKKRDGRRYLLDRKDIAEKRVKFLIDYMEAKNAKKPIIFLDETWIFRNGCSKTKEWQNKNRRSCSVRSIQTNARYIILHAGSKDGFVPGASFIHCTSQKPTKFDDYHGDMDGEMFQRWFQEQLLPNLKEPSVIVLDNASYHSVQFEKQPTSAWLKADLQQWLTERNVIWDSSMTKKKLLDLCAPLKSEESKNFLLDKYIAENTEHEILRLPPYHCCYNAIELAWANSKTYYDRHVGYEHKYSDERTKALWQEALDKVTPEVWKSMCAKVERKIIRHYNRYVLRLSMEEGKDPQKGLFEEATKSPASSVASSIPSSADEDDNEDTSSEEDPIEQIMKENEINEIKSSADDPRTVSRRVRRRIDLSFEPPIQVDHADENRQASSQIPCIQLTETAESGGNTSIQLSVRNMEVDDVDKKPDGHCGETSESNFQSDTSFQLPVSTENSQLDWLQKPGTTEIGYISRIKITVSDLSTLQEKEWLNDTIINSYMQLIMQADESIYALNSNFIQKLFNPPGIDRWTKNVDIFSKKIILIPYHTNGIHWALFVLNTITKVTTYYDSQSFSLPPALFTAIEQYLQGEFMRKRGVKLTGWSSKIAQDIPQQQNFYDCGVYTCMYARYICKDMPFNFSDKNMPEFRKQMINEILQQHLQPLPSFTQKKMQLRTIHDNVFLYESATYSQASIVFPKDRRNSQCMAIATYALAALTIHEEQSISQQIMNDILKKGDEYYVACRKHFKVSQLHLATDELLSPIIIGNDRIDIDICLLPFEGHFVKAAYKELLSVIQECVDTYKSSFNEWSFLFVGHCKAVGFKISSLSGGFLNKPEFLMFNSHRVDRDNKSILNANQKTGAARLFRCRSGESLAKMLLLQHDLNNATWHVYPMKITSTKIVRQ